MSRLKEAKKAVATAKHNLEKVAKELFREAADEFFAAHPELVDFSWKQYHSEHNDAYNHPFACLYDWCPLTFKDGGKTLKLVHEGEVYELLSDPDEEFFDGYEAALKIPRKEYELLRKKAWGLSDAVRKLVTSFEEEELEAMFGDPVEVIVTPKKFEIKEYWDFE
jgi:hypothetical protein